MTVTERQPSQLAVPNPLARSMPWHLPAALAAGGLIYWCLAHGWMLGTPVLTLTLAAVVLVPSAPHLSGRLLLNGSVAVTVVPVIAALPVPISLNPGALLAALSAFALVTVFGRRAKSMPSLMPIDALPVASAAIGALAMKDWLGAATPRGALVRLLPGYDYSAHFDMFELLRQHGRAIADLGPGPDGSAFAFRGYPLGYHALCAMIADLLSPVGSPPRDLVMFAVANGVVVAMGSMLLVAGICSVPAVRSNPGYAPIASLILICTVLTGVGASSISSGFVSFWLAAVLTGVAILVSRVAGVPWSVRVVVVQTLLVAVAFAWLPLVILGVPTALLLAQRGTHWRLKELMALCPGGLLVVVALIQITSETKAPVSGTLKADGAIPQSVLLLGASAAFSVLVLGVALRADLAERGAQHGAFIMRAPLFLTTLLGVGVALALGIYQMLTLHTLGYYFFKFLTGLDIVLAVVLVVSVLVPLARHGYTARPTSVLTTVVVVTVTGFVASLAVPGDAIGPGRDHSGTAMLGSHDSTTAISNGVLRASAWSAKHRNLSRRIWYVPLGSARGSNPQGAEQWFAALTGSLTEGGELRIREMRQYRDLPGAMEGLARVSGTRSGEIALTPPRNAGSLRQSLRVAGIEMPVATW